MKFLIHSNGPTAKTGYGVQCAMLADRLASDGHQVAVAANWGQQGSIGTWVSPKGHEIRVYPVGLTHDLLHLRAMHWFDGNSRGGWIITLLDVWGVVNPYLSEFNVIGWAPVDHEPVPPGVVNWFARTGATAVAMSRHGESEYRRVGLDPTYIPLAVDTDVYKPTFVSSDGQTSARELFHLPPDAFVVGMVGMNKDPADRKGFNEAFRAFATFQRTHRDAVLFVHSDPFGAGINLIDLAKSCGVPSTSIVFTDEFAYDVGLPPSFMAACYTAMDVLLAPSAGEGFCVPLIEAQACGTPVIASTFTAQPELVGAGWLLDGQLQWDQASRSNYFRAHIFDVVAKLELAHAADLPAMQVQARDFALRYNVDTVYDSFWRPYLATIEPPKVDKPPMESVAVIIPAMKRPQNVERLVNSFRESWADVKAARLYYVCDADDLEQIQAVHANGVEVLISDRGTSYACKVNSAVAQTTEEWMFVCGDDVEFTDGWLEAARKLSTQFDVIGTNDTDGKVRNPAVANGSHADHFFVRRSYVEELGACLDGPGVLAPEAYFHWFTDKEIIQLAKARGVFSPCLESVVIHHHPGFEGREDLRSADEAYSRAVEYSEKDEITFKKRARLIDQHKVVKGGIW